MSTEASPSRAERPARRLVVWCPDWPLRAAGIGPGVPAAVVTANRIGATSAAARDEGVEGGLRRRAAQARCPELVLVDDDPVRDARAFEPVAAALEELTPAVAVTRPGEATFPVRAARRWAGGERRLVELVLAAAHAALPGGDPIGARVGVAEGVVAATLAARSADATARCAVVGPGATPAFLAPLAVTSLLDHGVPAELVDRFRRLGLFTLGAVAALPVAAVTGRFGPAGVRAHRLCRGLDAEATVPRPRAFLGAVAHELDPPVDRVDRAAFAAKSLADELGARLAGAGLACSAVVVGAETGSGERWERCWRQDGPMGAETMTERVRWQLEGWLRAAPARRPDGPLVRLWLEPVEVAPDRGRQVGFWGASGGAEPRLTRAVARLESLLGQGAVTVPELGGGQGPRERVRRVVASGVTLSPDRPLDATGDDGPWPGRLPAPSPALVHDPPHPVGVHDEHGAEVVVDGRGLLTAPPARLTGLAPEPLPVRAWAGPWPVEGRWWDAEARSRRAARLQVVTGDGAAHLLLRADRRWWLEGAY